MNINHSPVHATPEHLKFLLPEPTLNDLLSPVENGFGIRVCLLDSNGQLFYGAAPAVDAASAELVAQQLVVGELRVSGADSTLWAAHLAQMLGHIATETARRRAIGNEILERYDELNVIYDLVALISSNTMAQTEVVKQVLNEANHILGAEAGAIYLCQMGCQGLEPIHYFGHEQGLAYWMGPLRDMARQVLYSTEDIQLSEDGQVICAPLRYNDDHLGVVLLIHRTPGHMFNANDVRLLTTLSHNTTLFLQAAHLIDTLARQKHELEIALAELQATRDELSRSERLSIIGQTIGGLVHDMRKPLNNVMGYAGLLQEPDLTQEERTEFAAQIITFINTFSSMAQEILDYTHGGDEEIQAKPTKVGDYMRFIEGRLKPPGLELPVNVIFNVAPAADYSMLIDPQRFVRVFQNLVNNAIDAVEDHGGTQVVVEAQPFDDTYVQFTVWDDGPGVPQQKIDTIFEPLITTKAHGTGLGLAIVQRMVDLHGGSIRYAQSPVGGAAFIFTVPQSA